MSTAQRLLLWLVVPVCTLGLWSLLPGAEYVHDDYAAVVGNPLVHWPPDLEGIFRGRYFGPVERVGDFPARPLATLLFALEIPLGLATPVGRHAVQLVLVIVVGWLLQGVATRLLRASGAAQPAWSGAALAALFTVHPVHAEVVANIAYRPELLSLALVLAATRQWVRIRTEEQPTRESWLQAGVASVLWLLALLAKESALAALGVWLVWATATAGARAKLLSRLGTLVPAGLGWFVWRNWNAQGNWTPTVTALDNPLAHVATDVRRWSALADAWRATQRLFWPQGLSPDYTLGVWPLEQGPSLLGTLAAGVLAVAAAGLLLAWWPLRAADTDTTSAAGGEVERRELPVLILGSALAFWLPLSNLLVASTVRFADRLLFASSIAAVAGLVWLGRRLPVVQLQVGAALVAVVALASWQRAEAAPWLREETLLQHGVARAPDSLRLRHNWAFWLSKHERLPEALQQVEALLRLQKQTGYRDAEQAMVSLDVLTASKACAATEQVVEWASRNKRSSRLRITLGRWGMTCGQEKRAWELVRGLRPVDGPDATDIYVLAVAAGDETGAAEWARTCGVPAPDDQPMWVAAAVFADQHKGRFAAAIDRLARLHQLHPEAPGLMEAARSLAAEAPAGPAADAATAALQRGFGAAADPSRR